MEYKPNILEVIERYKAFWNKDKLDRIPIKINFPVGSLSASDSYLEDRELEAKKPKETWENTVLDSEKYFNYWDIQLKTMTELLDDSIPTASTDLGPALMCGIMGAEIKFLNGTSWSNQPLEDWIDIDKYFFDPENKWIKFLEEMTNLFLKNSKEKFAVGLANFTGPGEILTGLRGPNQLCIDFYDHPKEIRKLAEKCVQAYIKAVNKQLNLIPRYYGGTCEVYMMWTPGRSNWLACDISSILSPELYHDFLFKYDQDVVDSLDNCWMHVHSAGAYMVKEFLELKGLKGVQIVNDKPAGPSIEELIPVMKKIQQKHCLILRKYSMGEIKKILPELSPAGLFIDTRDSSLKEAKKSLAEWSTLTKKL